MKPLAPPGFRIGPYLVIYSWHWRACLLGIEHFPRVRLGGSDRWTRPALVIDLLFLTIAVSKNP